MSILSGQAIYRVIVFNEFEINKQPMEECGSYGAHRYFNSEKLVCFTASARPCLDVADICFSLWKLRIQKIRRAGSAIAAWRAE